LTRRPIRGAQHRKNHAMADLNPQPLPPRQIGVTVHVPPEILSNLDSFQKVQASVFGRFGCPECNSGIQIDWRQIAEFVVTPELDLKPVAPAAQQFG
jgi:hypothetical protein